MICKRSAHKLCALLWEFVGDEFIDVLYEYPDITVHLTLFNATITEGVPQKLEHNDIKWITPADKEILKAIQMR